MNRKIWLILRKAVKELKFKEIIYIITSNLFSVSNYIINPILIKNIMDAIQNQDQAYFWFWIKIWVIYNICNYLIFDLRLIWWWIAIDINIAINVYKKRFGRIITLDNQYFENKWSSKISTITNEWNNAINNLSNRIFYNFLPAFFKIVAAFLFVGIYTNWKFLFVSLLIFIVYIFITYKAQNKARPNRKEQMKNNQNRNKHSSKVLASKIENLLSNKIDYETDTLKNYLNKTLSIALERMRILIPQNSQNIISPFSKTFSYIYYFYSFISGNITFGTIYIINDSINRIFQSISDTINLINDATEYYQKIEEFQSEIVEAPQMIGYYDGQKYIYKWWDINIDNISFTYTKFDKKELQNKKDNKEKHNKNGISQASEKSIEFSDKQSKYIFKNFSLKINGGRKIAFVWASWWGKTTLVKLILWLLNTNEGQIYIDDQKLPNTYISSNEYISLTSFYHYVWYLSQDPGVFDGNILDNLLYGLMENTNSRDDHLGRPGTNSDKSEYIANIYNSLNEEDQKYFTEEVIEKLSKYIPVPHEAAESTEEEFSDLIAKVKWAIADSKCNFVRDYDDGLLAQIGERWVKLSGGQKQRLAIAKLMIKNPKLIILDEPTSALDSFSEDGVTSAMERLFVDRTIIIIAHRLQTVKKADEIIVLENNKDGGSYIAERWNHEELIKNWWIYAKMLDLQSGF